VAKTATEIPITQGAGVNVSNFVLSNGRRRQTVILADADDAGEALLAELPAHDSVDRGSPLKIGGRATGNPFTAVADGDRVDAWFSNQGQQLTVNTIEPSVVYDGGRRTIGAQVFNVTAATTPLIAAVAGLRCKILSVHIACTNFSTVGQATLTAGGFPLAAVQIGALGNYALPTTGLALASTGVNQDLTWQWSGGAGNFAVSMTWYMTP